MDTTFVSYTPIRSHFGSILLSSKQHAAVASLGAAAAVICCCDSDTTGGEVGRGAVEVGGDTGRGDAAAAAAGTEAPRSGEADSDAAGGTEFGEADSDAAGGTNIAAGKIKTCIGGTPYAAIGTEIEDAGCGEHAAWRRRQQQWEPGAGCGCGAGEGEATHPRAANRGHAAELCAAAAAAGSVASEGHAAELSAQATHAAAASAATVDVAGPQPQPASRAGADCGTAAAAGIIGRGVVGCVEAGRC